MQVSGAADADASPMTEQQVRPRKSDTTIRRVSLLWVPVAVDATGTATAAWEAQ
jgi:hypothetical protein